MSMEYDDLDWGAAVRVIAAALQSESNGIPTFPHRPSLLSLRPPSQCFRGNEGVDWMMNNCEVSNREAAIFIGQALLNDGIFTSVMHEVHPEEGLQRFVDSDEHFYTFLIAPLMMESYIAAHLPFAVAILLEEYKTQRKESRLKALNGVSTSERSLRESSPNSLRKQKSTGCLLEEGNQSRLLPFKRVGVMSIELSLKEDREFCPDGPSCASSDPKHWIKYQHTPVEKQQTERKEHLDFGTEIDDALSSSLSEKKYMKSETSQSNVDIGITIGEAKRKETVVDSVQVSMCSPTFSSPRHFLEDKISQSAE